MMPMRQMPIRRVSAIAALAATMATLGSCSLGTSTMTPSMLKDGTHVVYTISAEEAENGRNAEVNVLVFRDGKALMSPEQMELQDLHDMTDEEVVDVVTEAVVAQNARYPQYNFDIEKVRSGEYGFTFDEIIETASSSGQDEPGFRVSDDPDSKNDEGCEAFIDGGYFPSRMIWTNADTTYASAKARFEEYCGTSIDDELFEQAVLDAAGEATVCCDYVNAEENDRDYDDRFCDYSFYRRLSTMTEKLRQAAGDNLKWLDFKIGVGPDETGNGTRWESLTFVPEEGTEGEPWDLFSADGAVNPVDGKNVDSVKGLEVYDDFYRYAWTQGEYYIMMRFDSREKAGKTVFELDPLDTKDVEIYED